MIVACENCKTRFRFDERLLKPSGIKVHCSRCEHTFTLKPAAAPVEPPEPDNASSPGNPADSERSGEDGKAAQGASFFDDPLPESISFDSVPQETETPSTEAAQQDTQDSLSAHAEENFVDQAIEESIRQVEKPKGTAEGEEEEKKEELDVKDGPDPMGASQPPEEEGREGAGETPFEEETASPERDDDDFDWDHVSFSGEDIPAEPITKPRKPAHSFDDPEREEALELANEPKVSPARRERIGKRPAAPSPGAEPPVAPVFVRLDLSQGARAGESAAPSSTPMPKAAADAPANKATAVEPSQAESGPTHGASRGLPARPRIRLQRSQLRLPKFTTLVISCALGIAVAVVSAFTLYAPASSGSYKAQPVGGAHPKGALSIVSAKGSNLARLEGPGIYMVTGLARWEVPVESSYYLEGVLVDPEGRALQRRSARLGQIADWGTIESVDPAQFGGRGALPREGETSFTILFTPEPVWQATVRFEIRKGR